MVLLVLHRAGDVAFGPVAIAQVHDVRHGGSRRLLRGGGRLAPILIRVREHFRQLTVAIVMA